MKLYKHGVYIDIPPNEVSKYVRLGWEKVKDPKVELKAEKAEEVEEKPAPKEKATPKTATKKTAKTKSADK